MSHTFRHGEVNELLDGYKSGDLTLDELAQVFRSRRWPRAEPPPKPKTYLEMAARAQQDPGSDIPDSFDDVEAAFFRNDLSVEEYECLRRAMNDALKAEDRGEL
jgi:hypothetical protein